MANTHALCVKVYWFSELTPLRNKILILGIGNVLMGDEGVGVHGFAI